MHEQDPGNLVRVPPDEYFGFPACRMCMWKSCKDLRYGGVHPGKFIFVHSRDYAGSGCVFLAESFDEIQDLLSSLPLQDLDLLVRDIIFDLSPGEQLHYDQRHFVWDFCDRAGRIAYLRRLWEDWVIVCLRVPFGYRSDPRLRSWLHATSGAYGFQFKGFEQEEDEGPALTDALADELTRAHPSLRNPAWSHTDETRREQSPKEAAYGDTVLLTADVRNIVDGARVTIEVFDTAVKPPRSVAQVRGTVQEQQARAEWTVERPKNAEEDEEGPRYEFEARYEGAKTGRCEIPLQAEQGMWFHIDLDDPLTDDDRVIVRTTDGAEEYVINMKDMVETREDFVLLPMPFLEDGKRYDLIYDPGEEGEPIVHEHDVDRRRLLELEEESGEQTA